MEYTYDDINILIQDTPLKLLRADHAPLIISFLYQSFKKNNKDTITNTELKTALSDFLYNLNLTLGETAFPSTAQEYLDTWANMDFLYKHYTTTSDEPVFELTPASEKALGFIKELEKREFIGTESRLIKIFNHLNEIVYISTTDPQKKIEELQKKRLEIDKEIERIKSGQVDKPNNVKIQELYFDVYDTTSKLLSDFKRIEYNFRDLNRKIREQQVHDNLSKGRLLDEVFQYQNMNIWNTAQGQSFKAFWDFLISPSKQDELSRLIELVCGLLEIKPLNKDDFLERIKINLVDAGDKVNRTNHDMNEQLRKYIDDRSYIESKHIREVIKDIKHYALQVKDNPPRDRSFFSIDSRPSIGFIMDRPLFNPAKSPDLRNVVIEDGDPDSVDILALYNQIYVNPEVLKHRIRQTLKTTNQTTLKQVTDAFPIEDGLEELVTYLSIASKSSRSGFNDDIMEIIIVRNRRTNKRFQVEVPRVMYYK
ncbi:MAG: DUF3375 domain-containing protein [Euryarchaeota archaeon]|nr:DUF3375 domain-containing protein [Euryarchaeota archaeon]